MSRPERDIESDVLAGVVTWRDMWPALDQRERALRADLERDLTKEITHLRGAIDGLSGSVMNALDGFRLEAQDRRNSARWWFGSVIALACFASTVAGMFIAQR